jgi:hypothetical protein
LSQEHGAAVLEFLSGVKAARLFAYIDGDALYISPNVPAPGWSKMLAFVRDPFKAGAYTRPLLSSS